MTLTLTIAALRERAACGLELRIADLRRVLPDVADDEPVSLEVWWALPSTSVPDRWWSLRAAAPEIDARSLAVRAACRAARRVLHLAREQGLAACLGAIEAAEAWAEEPTEERARAASDYASDAADYASDAADYASDAGTIYAAHAAAHAAHAAADAAHAAHAAAHAADYAARAADFAARAAAFAARADAFAARADAFADAAERKAQRADLDELLAGGGQ